MHDIGQAFLAALALIGSLDRELIEIAFKDRLIDTMEHPVIRDLHGDI